MTEYPQSARVNASLYGWGWTAMQEHQCATAVLPWEQLLQRDAAFPQALSMHYQLGICYLQLEQPAKAREHLQQVVDTGASTPYFQDALGRLAAAAFPSESMLRLSVCIPGRSPWPARTTCPVCTIYWERRMQRWEKTTWRSSIGSRYTAGRRRPLCMPRHCIVLAATMCSSEPGKSPAPIASALGRLSGIPRAFYGCRATRASL